MLEKDTLTSVVTRLVDSYALKSLTRDKQVKKVGLSFQTVDGSLYDRWIQTSLMLLTVAGHQRLLDDEFHNRHFDTGEYQIHPVIQKLIDVADVRMFQASDVMSKSVFSFDYQFDDIMSPYEYNAFESDLDSQSRTHAFSNVSAPQFKHLTLSELPVIYLSDGELHKVGTSDSVKPWQIVLLDVTADLDFNYAPKAAPLELQEAINDAVEDTKSTKN